MFRAIFTSFLFVSSFSAIAQFDWQEVYQPSPQRNIFLVDSVYCAHFPNGVETPLNRTYNNDFTPSGAILEAVTQEYDATTQTYTSVRREVYERNANNDPTQFTIQLYDAASMLFVNHERKLYDPTPDGFFEEVISQTWTNGAWQNVLLEDFSFISGTNRPFRFKISHWNEGLGVWENQAQFIYVYDGQQRLYEVRFQQWNSSQLSWNDLNRTIHYYDSNGRDSSSVVSLPGSQPGQWLPSSRERFEYYQDGKLFASQRELFDNTNGGWIPQNRTQFEYNTDGQETLKLERNWIGNGFVDFFRFTTQYDADGNQTNFRGELFENDSWNPTLDCDLFYRSFVSSTRSPVGALPCRMANPTVAGATIECGELSRGTYQLYSVNGQRVAQKEFSENSLQLPHSVPTDGWYLLHLRTEDGRQYTERLFIRN